MSYFDDYYSSQPEQPQQANPYIPPQQPKAPKVRKERKALRRIVSAVLVLALVVASCGATAFVLNNRFQKKLEIVNQQMDEKLAAMQQQLQTPAVSQLPGDSVSKPLASGEYLTPGQVYSRNVNAVVAVTAQITKPDAYGGTASGYSSGTGFIISADGYVVTNYHVIEDGSEVTITMHNDTEYDAEIVGYEANNDLALLKVNEENMPYVTIGNSSQLYVGDQVVAIGNVLSTFASSLTVGYVSGVDRVVDTDGTAMNMIQTDVAINSGNSGGPLFNMKGEVVGITTAKFSGNSSSGASIEGIGFAIPMDDVKGMIEDLKNYGYVTGAYLGVMVRDVESTAQYYGLPAGAFVESADVGSAAKSGGIQAQDIIVEVGGHKVTSVSDLTRVLRKFEAGQTVTVKVYRNGQYIDCLVTLDEKPREETKQPAAQEPAQAQPQTPFSGGDSFQDWYDIFRDYFG